MPGISVLRLFQDNQKKLQLAWSEGIVGADQRIAVDSNRPLISWVGHLNFIHPNRIQVVGLVEHQFLMRLENGEESSATLSDLFNLDVALIIVANDLPVPYRLRDYCYTRKVALMTSPVESPHLMDILRIYLQRALAVSTVMHGVFLDVFELGVLITGQSGLGKSELALELISRGHRLVADDAVELYRTAPEILEGTCPPVLRDFLEVRGLGILNIRTIFGENSIRQRKNLRLIINLVHADDQYMKDLDRLKAQSEYQDILDVSVRQMTLPVAIGRNLAVLVEAAVQNYALQVRGIDSTQEFIDRHQAALQEDENSNAHSD